MKSYDEILEVLKIMIVPVVLLIGVVIFIKKKFQGTKRKWKMVHRYYLLDL